MSQEQLRQTTPAPQETQADTTKAVAKPDISAILTRPVNSSGKISVVSGANQEYFSNLAGRTVAQVRKRLRDSFNIANDAVAHVNGEPVAEDHVLAENTSLEFLKEAGTKGSLAKVAAGLSILAESDKGGHIAAEHDEIYAGSQSPEELGEEKVKLLKKYGWTWDKSLDTWHTFV